jgi:hypothetical protein
VVVTVHFVCVVSMPIGCLSNEPYQCIVCNRLDDEWRKKTLDLMSMLSEGLKGQVQQGDMIAIASNCHLKGSINCIYKSYDIVKVMHVEDSTFLSKHLSVYLIQLSIKIKLQIN